MLNFEDLIHLYSIWLKKEKRVNLNNKAQSRYKFLKIQYIELMFQFYKDKNYNETSNDILKKIHRISLEINSIIIE